jgi:hypothetical protein
MSGGFTQARSNEASKSELEDDPFRYMGTRSKSKKIPSLSYSMAPSALTNTTPTSGGTLRNAKDRSRIKTEESDPFSVNSSLSASSSHARTVSQKNAVHLVSKLFELYLCITPLTFNSFSLQLLHPPTKLSIPQGLRVRLVFRLRQSSVM